MWGQEGTKGGRSESSGVSRNRKRNAHSSRPCVRPWADVITKFAKKEAEQANELGA